MEITKDYLLKEYSYKKRSMEKISKDFNTSPQKIMRFIHRYNIPINKYPKAWNSGKTYKEDQRILAKEKHPRTKNSQYYTSDFKRIRKKILPCKCNVCNREATLVHHKDFNKMNNELENLEPLCSSCHTTIHNKLRGITIYKHLCKDCGGLFIVKHNRSCKQRFCSLSCKAKYRYYKEDNPLRRKNQKIKS